MKQEKSTRSCRWVSRIRNLFRLNRCVVVQEYLFKWHKIAYKSLFFVCKERGCLDDPFRYSYAEHARNLFHCCSYKMLNADDRQHRLGIWFRECGLDEDDDRLDIALLVYYCRLYFRSIKCMDSLLTSSSFSTQGRISSFLIRLSFYCAFSISTKYLCTNSKVSLPKLQYLRTSRTCMGNYSRFDSRNVQLRMGEFLWKSKTTYDFWFLRAKPRIRLAVLCMAYNNCHVCISIFSYRNNQHTQQQQKQQCIGTVMCEYIRIAKYQYHWFLFILAIILRHCSSFPCPKLVYISSNCCYLFYFLIPLMFSLNIFRYFSLFVSSRRCAYFSLMMSG